MHMHTYACICMHMHAYACICMHMHAYACICIHMHAYACICMRMHAHASICTHTHAYACICMHMHPYAACASICMHMHAYARIRIPNDAASPHPNHTALNPRCSRSLDLLLFGGWQIPCVISQLRADCSLGGKTLYQKHVSDLLMDRHWGNLGDVLQQRKLEIEVPCFDWHRHGAQKSKCWCERGRGGTTIVK